MGSAIDIISLIPQRPPFVMVGKLLYSDETITRTGFKIKSDNLFVSGGIFTEPGLVENIAQTAAARAGYIAQTQGAAVQLGYIGAIKGLEIIDLPVVGDELETEVMITSQVFNVSVVKGKVWCSNVLMAQCEMKIFISPSK